LTTPAAGILYGGHKKGSFEFSVQNNNMIGTAEMYNLPADEKVYEGWFEDNHYFNCKNFLFSIPL
jgi:hypothetical protein